jgi:metal-responsive CopG/Arc/MetJ family transcriptional regulator
MKTVVTIPDDVFAGAERLARRLEKSRSELYSQALREFVSRHSSEDVTEALNKLCGELPDCDDRFATEVSRRRSARAEW